jgi:hypothetical protein
VSSPNRQTFRISGTPDHPGTVNLVIDYLAWSGDTVLPHTDALTLTVLPALAAIHLGLNPQPITPTVAFSKVITFDAQWFEIVGLPAWAKYDNLHHTLRGTAPATAANQSFDVTFSAFNSVNERTMATLRLSVGSPPVPPVVTTPTGGIDAGSGVVDGVVGVPLQYTVAVYGTPRPSVTADLLPSGLSLGSTNGVPTVTGRPTTAGFVDVTFTASTVDSNGKLFQWKTTIRFIIRSPSVDLSVGSSDAGRVGTDYRHPIAVVGSPTPTLTASGLPPGLALSSSPSGEWAVSGKPTTAGTYPVTVTATATADVTTQQQFTITVAAMCGAGALATDGWSRSFLQDGVTSYEPGRLGYSSAVHASADVPECVVVDLGSERVVGQVRIWAAPTDYGQYLYDGFPTRVVAESADDPAFTQNVRQLGTMSLPSSWGVTSEWVTPPAGTSGRYVRLTATTLGPLRDSALNVVGYALRLNEVQVG